MAEAMQDGASLEPNIIRILLHANLAKIKDVLHHKKKKMRCMMMITYYIYMQIWLNDILSKLVLHEIAVSSYHTKV